MQKSTPAVQRTTRGQYLPRRWRPVTTGVHLVDGADTDLRSQLLAWQQVLPPGATWSHLTGAALRGWWRPPVPAGLPVVAAHDSGRRIRRTGLVAIRRRRTVPYEMIAGLPVDPPAEIVAACAAHLSELDLACLVAAAQRSGTCTADDLRGVATRDTRGIQNLRKVLARADDRYESIWEVVLAELHRVCGIAVQPQKEVFDETGTFAARGDLWLVGTTRLHEYDGRWHGGDRQRSADLRREGRILRAGWSRRGYVSADLLHGAVRILEDADHALGRPHDPERIRVWHRLLGRSMFTPGGRTALLRRLGVQ
ncbi:hypothetical protein ACQCX2_04015 [Propionibacteriaceae bacterium Y1700]|uniref:hypothetical protein n=1 Tax=Microlunatus sp. Y1700 TaxID=3418487 RepID=UPI003DA71427